MYHHRLIFVAGPMTGRPGFNFRAFHEASRALRDQGHAVVNPAELLFEPERPWDYYLRRSIPLLLESTAVAMLEGWEESRGAKLEVHIADALGYELRPWHEWLDVPVATATPPGG